MHIGMVLASGNYPPDVRVEKEAAALLTAGHHITVVCDRGQPGIDVYKGSQVIHLPNPWLHRRFGSAWFFLTFYNPFWANWLDKLVTQYHFDALHVHDLPMTRTALHVGHHHDLPVVLDLHELQIWINPRSFPLNLLYTQRRWLPYLMNSVAASTRVIVVVQEARAWLGARGASTDKIAVVSNTVPPDRLTSMPLDETVVNQFADDYVISYIGGFGWHRGLDVAVRAMPQVLTQQPNARLVLVGGSKGDPLVAELRQLAGELGVEDRVNFMGWQPFDLVPSYIVQSDVGLVSHRATTHTNTTIPHKLFQYMSLNRPVVVSDCPPLKRVIQCIGGGLVFQAGDPESLAEALIRLADPVLRAKMGKSARQGVEGEFNWSHSAQVLRKLYASLDGCGDAID